MSVTFAVLGDGAWGTAIALHLAARPNHHVRLWSARPENAALLRQHRENRRFLPGILIRPEITLTDDIVQATADADLWVSAIPTKYLRDVLTRLSRELGPVHVPAVVSLTKGIEVGTFARPTEIIRSTLGAERVAVLSGPSHAEEVSRNKPTTLVAASDDEALALDVQRHFNSDRFRVYTNLDPVGVELAGALKNIIGIAAGISIGLDCGDNALSALMTRGLHEMTKFGTAHGAEPATFAGLAGLGDLITTCISRHGRNRAVGERLGRGEKIEAIITSMEQVAEGVTTTKAVHERAGQMGTEMPITAEVYRVLYAERSPQEALGALMGRSPKKERWGA
jgi:glycerol-3-phosphate dehydrogenase (NAD(P)+)